MTAAVTQHVGARQGHLNWRRTHSSYQDGCINGRPAQPWELEVRERAWQQQLERDAQQVRVAERTTP